MAAAERAQRDCAGLKAEGTRTEADLRELEGLLRDAERVGPGARVHVIWA